MKFIGIDPSLNNTGVAIFHNDKLESVETISPKVKLSRAERQKFTAIRLQEIMLTHEPICVGVEVPVMGKGANASLVVAEAVGLLKGIVYSCGASFLCDIIDVNVQSAKSQFGAKRSEGKKAMLNKAREIFPDVEIKKDHEADAVAIGMYAKARCILFSKTL